ncbi:MAG: ABC-F family ATP-binding cassette domain-containing protein [Bifidobacteriaceae bacterium]|jgi:ATPase subunit of ABC transporter with duplicated ATPase domains|nr:ABC-F family ATP-binding cassette domain-containing protein [Bifidobacteriaceae bacterium]
MAYAGKPVLADVSLGLADGDRIGIVGRNGEGKSTLVGLLAGRITPDGGRVTRRSGVTVGFLGQADQLDPAATVRQAVVGGQADHVWAAEAASREVMTALLGDVPLEAVVGELSGGQRRRAALAHVLLERTEVLFLDEPTNHLDLEAITWLAGHLKARWPAGKGALGLITHDRWFLDQVSLDTWEVHDAVVEPFEGGYAAYVLQRVERDRQAAAGAARRRNILRKELAWLRRGAPARTSKPKFRLDVAAALIADEPEPRDPVALSRLAMTRLGKDVVDLEEVTAGYDGRPVIEQVTWLIGPGDRLGLLGANGAGKSTLLAVMTGALAPMAGRVKRGKTVRIAQLSQDMSEIAAIADQRILDVIERLKASYQAGGRAAGSWTGGGRGAKPGWAAGAEEMTPTALLERLGFQAHHLSTPVRDLSGGQRRRLQLALVLMEEPNVLILDEPSNDLDTDMLAAVEDLLDTWPGTLIVVSHDRYLVERVTDQQFALLGGRLRHVPGGIDEYLALSASAASGPSPSTPSSPSSSTPSPPSSRKVTFLARKVNSSPVIPGLTRHPGDVSAGQEVVPDGVRGPGVTELTSREVREAKKAMAAAERRLERLRAEMDQVNQTLAGADPTDYLQISALTAKLTGLSDSITAEEERWLELAEAAGL